MTLYDAEKRPIQRGDLVRLRTKPVHGGAFDYPLTEGAVYEAVDFVDGNLLTTSDVAGYEVGYASHLVEKVASGIVVCVLN